MSIRWTLNDLENSDMRSFSPLLPFKENTCSFTPCSWSLMPVTKEALFHVAFHRFVPRITRFPFPMTHLMFSLGLSREILGFVYIYVHVYMSVCLCSSVYMSVCGNKRISAVVSWICHGLLLT